MTRQSQLQKFAARMGKKRQDEEAIRIGKMKQEQSMTIEKVAETEMSKLGMKAEDIFAVFGRDHIGPFIQQWNQSLSGSITESVAPLVQEIKELRLEIEYLREENKRLREASSNVEETVTTTMIRSFEGLMKGITDSMTPQKSSLQILVENLVEKYSEEDKLTEEETALSQASKSVSLEIQDHEKVDSIPRTGKGIDWKYILDNDLFDSTMYTLLSIAEDEGVNIRIAKKFKMHGSDFNGAYQRFMIVYKGEKGAWRNFVKQYESMKVGQ